MDGSCKDMEGKYIKVGVGGKQLFSDVLERLLTSLNFERGSG
jgi:hypothetical protein